MSEEMKDALDSFPEVPNDSLYEEDHDDETHTQTGAEDTTEPRH